jgi:hypothetical protein
MTLNTDNTAAVESVTAEAERAARQKHHEMMETLFDKELPNMVGDEWLKILSSKRLPAALTFDIRTLVERFNYMSVRLEAYEKRFSYEVFDNAYLKHVLERTPFDAERPPLDENYLGWIHDRDPVTWRELLHPDTPTEGIANVIESFVCHNAEKLGLDERTVINLRAASERISFMLTRLRLFEGNLGIGDFGTKDIETFIKDNQSHFDHLKAKVPGYRTGSPPEPESFEVRTFGTRTIRILNKVWLEWYAKVNSNQTEGSCINACARRVVETLFPSAESKVGVQWQVGTEDQWRNYRGEEEPLFPMEIRITRVTKTVL